MEVNIISVPQSGLPGLGTRRLGDQGPGPAEEGMGPVALLRSWNGDTVNLDPGLDLAWTPALDSGGTNC